MADKAVKPTSGSWVKDAKALLEMGATSIDAGTVRGLLDVTDALVQRGLRVGAATGPVCGGDTELCPACAAVEVHMAKLCGYLEEAVGSNYDCTCPDLPPCLHGLVKPAPEDEAEVIAAFEAADRGELLSAEESEEVIWKLERGE